MTHSSRLAAAVLCSVLIFTACSSQNPERPNMLAVKDVHSLSNSQQVRVTTVDLDLTVHFESKTLTGTATLNFTPVDESAQTLVLDTRKLNISKTELSEDGHRWIPTNFSLGHEDPILGSPLTIQTSPSARIARITYSTSPAASGLQWLTPQQTAGKKYPFVYSQSQAIHARSWIPIQDTPSVRITFNARIHTPRDAMAVMSALNDRNNTETGVFTFQLGNPIPPYLIALAVGDITFKSTGRRSGVYAEPPVLDAAAEEFADMGKMIDATEDLFGPYRWDRYDILVLPPSFPFGGMENPRLTFATPTVIAGDKSLVSLVAHELAHSWSGNLVTNATWSDFWLNEGYTVYIERRILEHIYGRDRAEMEAVLGRQELEDELKTLPPGDQILHIDLKGRDPDDGATTVPYEKGYLFLLSLEKQFGRENFDNYLRAYFDRYSFQSITTETALAFMKTALLEQHPELAKNTNLDEWINKPGIPPNAPRVQSKLFDKVDQVTKSWTSGSRAVDENTAKAMASWSTQEWLRFLRGLPPTLGAAGMERIDAARHLTQSHNDEILAQWLLMALRFHYTAVDARLAEFLETVGRRKYIKPLYEELAKTPAGRERAIRIYRVARPRYHPIAQTTIDAMLKVTI